MLAIDHWRSPAIGGDERYAGEGGTSRGVGSRADGAEE